MVAVTSGGFVLALLGAGSCVAISFWLAGCVSADEVCGLCAGSRLLDETFWLQADKPPSAKATTLPTRIAPPRMVFLRSHPGNPSATDSFRIKFAVSRRVN